VIDYLLKFPSKSVAEQFGIASGFAVVGEDGSVTATFASHEYAIHEIGEHNGNDYWFLFRDLVGIPIPEGADQFIFWASTLDTPRPTDDPTIPNIFWA
jgi:hypothetical protein